MDPVDPLIEQKEVNQLEGLLPHKVGGVEAVDQQATRHFYWFASEDSRIIQNQGERGKGLGLFLSSYVVKVLMKLSARYEGRVAVGYALVVVLYFLVKFSDERDERNIALGH